MQDLSLHILDIVENSLMAEAGLVTIGIVEDSAADTMTIAIEDNGQGMSHEFLTRVTDPFVTFRTTRRVGLGLSLMQANARLWGGDLRVESAPGRGTRVKVWFMRSHIDRPPLGDWPRTLLGLIMTRPETEFVYRHQVGEDEFELDTRELKTDLGPEALTDPQVMALLRGQVEDALEALGVAQVPSFSLSS